MAAAAAAKAKAEAQIKEAEEELAARRRRVGPRLVVEHDQDDMDPLSSAKLLFATMLQRGGEAAWRRGKRVLVVVDSVDELENSHGALDLDWVPTTTPACLQVLVSFSILPDHPCITAANKREPPMELHIVEDLSKTEREDLVRYFLAMNRKKLNDEQLALIVAKGGAGAPLYLRVACEELMVQGQYGDGTFLNTMIQTMPETIPELFAYVLERLEQDMSEYTRELYHNQLKMSTAEAMDMMVDSVDFNFDSVAEGLDNRSGREMSKIAKLDGAGIVQAAMTFLVCSRTGLLEQELLDLLRPSNAEKLPAAVSTRLFHGLWLYLQRGDASDQGIIRFTHRQLKDAVRLRYFRNSWIEEAKTFAKLAAFMKGTADPSGDLTWLGCRDGTHMSAGVVRSFEDLPWYQLRGYQLGDLRYTLCGLSFIEARCRIIAAEAADGGLGGGGGSDVPEDDEAARARKRADSSSSSSPSSSSSSSSSSAGSIRSRFGQLLHDYRQAVDLLDSASLQRLKPSLRKARLSRQELLKRVAEFEVFVHSQHLNLIAAPALTPQLALAQPTESAPYRTSKRFLQLRVARRPGGAQPRLLLDGAPGGGMDGSGRRLSRVASARSMAAGNGDGGSSGGGGIGGGAGGGGTRQRALLELCPATALLDDDDNNGGGGGGEDDDDNGGGGGGTTSGPGGGTSGGGGGGSTAAEDGSDLIGANVQLSTIGHSASMDSVNSADTDNPQGESGRHHLHRRYRHNVLPFCCQWLNKPSKNRVLGDFGPFSSHVTAVAVSRTAPYFIAVGLRNGSLKLLSASTGATVRQLGSRRRGDQGHSKTIRSITFSGDGGGYLLTAGEDGLCLLWSVSTGSVVVSLPIVSHLPGRKGEQVRRARDRRRAQQRSKERKELAAAQAAAAAAAGGGGGSAGAGVGGSAGGSAAGSSAAGGGEAGGGAAAGAGAGGAGLRTRSGRTIAKDDGGAFSQTAITSAAFMHVDGERGGGHGGMGGGRGLASAGAMGGGRGVGLDGGGGDDAKLRIVCGVITGAVLIWEVQPGRDAALARVRSQASPATPTAATAAAAAAARQAGGGSPLPPPPPALGRGSISAPAAFGGNSSSSSSSSDDDDDDGHSQVTPLWVSEQLSAPTLSVAFTRGPRADPGRQKVAAEVMPLVAAGLMDGRVILWDASAPHLGLRQVQSMRAHSMGVSCLSFSDDASGGGVLASGGLDGVVCFWHRRNYYAAASSSSASSSASSSSSSSGAGVGVSAGAAASAGNADGEDDADGGGARKRKKRKGRKTRPQDEPLYKEYRRRRAHTAAVVDLAWSAASSDRVKQLLKRRQQLQKLQARYASNRRRSFA